MYKGAAKCVPAATTISTVGLPALHPVETELTTAATDAVLGLLCTGLALVLALQPVTEPFKRNVWLAVLIGMALGSFLGAVAHGLQLTESTKALLWKPLYLSLGVTVALVAVGAVYDWWGIEVARRVLPWAVVAGIVFFAASQLLGGAFAIFIAYEGVAIITALTIYTLLAIRGGMPGATAAAVGLVLSMVAAIVQVTPLGLTLIWRFDHNGLFHLIQMVAIVAMSAGIRQSLLTP